MSRSPLQLQDLQAQFVKHCGDGNMEEVDTLVTADGIVFLCPKCIEGRSDGVGVHSVLCWSPGVPRDVVPGPGRWSMVGTGLRDLSLIAKSNSVQLNGGCGAHFFIERGAVRMA